MIGQLQFTPAGQVKDKVELAIQRLKSFEPEEGYYVAFSGGKDSQCIYHLCKMAGVKFDAHYAVTSVDPPELVRFIMKNYPDVAFERQYDADGKPITMWSLIASHTLPPTRKVRYCCAYLKETGGKGRVVVTGVRWAESANRKKTHDVVDIRGKKAIKKADAMGAEYRLNKNNDLVMNDDNATSRRLVESCFRTSKTMVNPIVDWEEEDVWNFLNGNNIPHCSLYDEGFKRLGCIGCPLSGSKNMIRDFERWPRYKELYIRAFQKMIDNHPGQIKILDPTADTKFKLYDHSTATEMLGGGYQELTSDHQTTLSDGIYSDGLNNFAGGGTMVQMVDTMEQLEQCSASLSATATDKNIAGGGTSGFSIGSETATEYVFQHWMEMGAT